MLIDGPLDIKVVDNSSSQSRELELNFTAKFQNADIATRINEFKQHIAQLQASIHSTKDAAEQQGMVAILQICEELLPHIEADEIPLNETLAIEIGQGSPFEHLLSGATLK